MAKIKIATVLLYIAAGILAILPAVPLALLISLAFSEHPVYIHGFTLKNFDFLKTGKLFADNPTYSALYPDIYLTAFNTFLLAIGNAVLVVLISSTAAYIISRYNFRGRVVLLSSFLIMHGVPASVLLIALYYMLKTMGLLNTLLGVVLVKMAVDLPLGIWVLKGFYDSIPWDIEISALVDGTSRFGVFSRIMLPLVKPGIFAIGLFSFLSGWGEYIFVYTFIHTSTNWTFSMLIRSLFSEMGGINLALVASLSLIYLIPVIILFVIGEKYLVRLTIGGVKG